MHCILNAKENVALVNALNIINAADHSKIQQWVLIELVNALKQKTINQQTIYNQLTKEGIIFIMALMYHPLKSIRQLSIQTLCLLLQANDDIQTHFCSLYGFTPLNGQIALNKIPEPLKLQLLNNKDLLQSIKKSALGIKDTSLYWSYPVYNGKPPNLSPIKDPSMEDDIDFPDPKCYLIGFICKLKQYKAPKNIIKRPLTSAT